MAPAKAARREPRTPGDERASKGALTPIRSLRRGCPLVVARPLSRYPSCALDAGPLASTRARRGFGTLQPGKFASSSLRRKTGYLPVQRINHVRGGSGIRAKFRRLATWTVERERADRTFVRMGAAIGSRGGRGGSRQLDRSQHGRRYNQQYSGTGALQEITHQGFSLSTLRNRDVRDAGLVSQLSSSLKSAACYWRRWIFWVIGAFRDLAILSS
jgi:hypothetical protein